MPEVTITSLTTGQQTGPIDTDSIVDALTAWFSGAPAEVIAEVERLQRFARAGQWEEVNAVAGSLDVNVQRPSRDDVLALVRETTEAVIEAQDSLAAHTVARDEAIRRAFDERLPGPAIAEASGMTTTRVYQIRDGRR